MSKNKIVDQYKVHGTDTGSPEVQVALLTNRIEELAKHFQRHVKDNTSRRGMMKLISRRKGLLEYVKRSDMERYKKLISSLGLRK